MARLHQSSDDEFGDLDAIINRHTQRTFPTSSTTLSPVKKPALYVKPPGLRTSRSSKDSGKSKVKRTAPSTTAKRSIPVSPGASAFRIQSATVAKAPSGGLNSEPAKKSTQPLRPKRTAVPLSSTAESGDDSFHSLSSDNDYLDASIADEESSEEWPISDLTASKRVPLIVTQSKQKLPERQAVKNGVLAEVVDLTFSDSEGKSARPKPPTLQRPLASRSTTASSRPSSSSDKDKAALLSFNPSPKKRPASRKPRLPSSESSVNGISATGTPLHLLEVVDIFEDDAGPVNSTPTLAESSPRKQPVNKNPRKKADPEVQSRAAAKKHWDCNKEGLAIQWLAELDKRVTGGKLYNMIYSSATNSCSGLGPEIEWVKTLNTTAGTAQSTRRRDKIKHPDGTTEVNESWTVKIRLAEKVIDNEHKLKSTLAHEYCHLLTHMISGVKGNPHGKEFKEWGRKVSKAFADENIKVTTKHSYDIDFKYIWQCVACKMEYKRHSKSIDPKRHACGCCKAQLEQVKPKLKNGGVQNEYQKFLKDNYARVKAENPGWGMGEVTERVARLYRETKASAGLVGAPDVAELNNVTERLAGVAI